MLLKTILDHAAPAHRNGDAEMAVLQAKESLRKANDQFESGRKLAELGFVTSLQREADQFALDRAKNELHAAEVEMEVLEKYTKAKRIKLLDSSIAISAARRRWRGFPPGIQPGILSQSPGYGRSRTRRSANTRAMAREPARSRSSRT